MNQILPRFVLLVTMVACCAARAQTVPQLMNYQGQLQDAKGVPLPTSDYSLSFSIWDAATGGKRRWGPQLFDGQQIGMPGHGSKVPVVQGYFNAMLGPVDTNNVSIADAFAATNSWIEVTVGGNPPISPRQQMVSAPSAVSAQITEKTWA